MIWTPWWGTMLDGLVGAMLGGLVAAGTALIVVRLTAKQERNTEQRARARTALTELMLEAESLREALREEWPELQSTRPLWRSLTPARLALEGLGDGVTSTALRVECSRFTAVAQARTKGGSFADVNDSFNNIRAIVKSKVLEFN